MWLVNATVKITLPSNAYIESQKLFPLLPMTLRSISIHLPHEVSFPSDSSLSIGGPDMIAGCSSVPST
jgi:hypothetical protein